jgi:hypothetical protein
LLIIQVPAISKLTTSELQLIQRHQQNNIVIGWLEKRLAAASSSRHTYIYILQARNEARVTINTGSFWVLQGHAV